jgi:hypothetical protein
MRYTMPYRETHPLTEDTAPDRVCPVHYTATAIVVVILEQICLVYARRHLYATYSVGNADLRYCVPIPELDQLLWGGLNVGTTTLEVIDTSAQ